MPGNEDESRLCRRETVQSERKIADRGSGEEEGREFRPPRCFYLRLLRWRRGAARIETRFIGFSASRLSDRSLLIPRSMYRLSWSPRELDLGASRATDRVTHQQNRELHLLSSGLPGRALHRSEFAKATDTRRY